MYFGGSRVGRVYFCVPGTGLVATSNFFRFMSKYVLQFYATIVSVIYYYKGGVVMNLAQAKTNSGNLVFTIE